MESHRFLAPPGLNTVAVPFSDDASGHPGPRTPTCHRSFGSFAPKSQRRKRVCGRFLWATPIGFKGPKLQPKRDTDFTGTPGPLWAGFTKTLEPPAQSDIVLSLLSFFLSLFLSLSLSLFLRLFPSPCLLPVHAPLQKKGYWVLGKLEPQTKNLSHLRCAMGERSL